MANEGFTGTKPDLIEHLTSEHRQVEQLWSQLQVAHRNGDKLQADLGQRIVSMLSSHDALELQFLYPTLADLPTGKGMADHGRDDHSEIRDLLAKVDGKDPADEEIYRTFEKVMTEVDKHVQEEERQMFPALRQHLSEDKLIDLGEKSEKAEAVAPSHPHPNTTPDGKVGATIAGAAAGAMDKVRDKISGKG